MSLSEIAGIKCTPIKLPERPKRARKLPPPPEVRDTGKKVFTADPFCVAAKCLSDEEIAEINKMGILPMYAKVVEGKNGPEIMLAVNKNDGNHKLPDGFVVKNTQSGRTIITKNK